MANVVILNHPLITHKLALLRDEKTNTKEFREYVSEIGGLITYEITRDIKLKEVVVKTPIAKMKTMMMAEEVVIVPILRAGLGMVDGINKIIPTAKIGHIGLYRDEVSLTPHQYYAKFPSNIKDALVLLVDPMLATGNSAVEGVNILKDKGVKRIKYVGLVGTPEGVKRLSEAHPDVDIYLAVQDEGLNKNGYIVPGLGDCGDRLFGTK